VHNSHLTPDHYAEAHLNVVDFAAAQIAQAAAQNLAVVADNLVAVHNQIEGQ
jgi:hypothetical protein